MEFAEETHGWFVLHQDNAMEMEAVMKPLEIASSHSFQKALAAMMIMPALFMINVMERESVWEQTRFVLKMTNAMNLEFVTQQPELALMPMLSNSLHAMTETCVPIPTTVLMEFVLEKTKLYVKVLINAMHLVFVIHLLELAPTQLPLMELDVYLMITAPLPPLALVENVLLLK